MSIPTGDYESKIQKAIKLLGSLSSNSNDEVAFKLLVDNGIDSKEAIEFILFLPTIFCRILLPNIPWLDTYIEVENNIRTLKRYSYTSSYKLMWDFSLKYAKAYHENKIFRNIANRSSEFDVLEKYLKDGGDLENIELFPTEIYL